MKKIFYFAAVLSAFITSCTSKEEFIESETVVSTITATFDHPATNVQMGTSDGTNTPLQWNAGDKLAVYNATSQTYGLYQTESTVSDGAASAKFELKEGDAIVTTEHHLAVYPFERICSTQFLFEYATTQTYTENSFDRLAMPMVASNASGTNFTFSAQAAVLRLKVSTETSDVTVNSIEITSASKALTGYAAPNMTQGTYGVPDVSLATSGKKDTLKCETPVTINSIAKDFNIVVPAQTYPSGDLTITVKTNKGVIEKTSKAAATFAAGKVYNLTISGEPVLALPAGALSGKFSVGPNATDKVHFSKGNLYWDGSAFKFEANQYSSASSWDASHVSHFYWSKTASVAYANGYNDGSASGSDVFFTNETETTSKDGFTVNVGGTEQTGWRTLSTAEWTYLFNNHTKKWATVNGVNGYVIAPDGFTGELASSYADDAALASAGNLVFLPAAGSRSGSNVNFVGDIGYYWSSTASGEYSACYVFSHSSDVDPDDIGTRSNVFSVRLVTDAE